MFEVKIFDGKGNLKEIIPADEVERKYWLEFNSVSGNQSVALRRKNNAAAKKRLTELGK